MSRRLPSALNVFGNPLFIKCARSRLRPKHVVAWGLVTLVITAFVFMMVYLTASQRGLLESQQAARGAMVPIIVIQAIILMLLGTGSVASGLALERDAGVLDYHRINPMSPTSKIVGYLFGLPVREYVLFGITMPFMLFCVIVGEMPWLKVAHFYAVFLSSVWLYHMTGMVAGMVSPRPRRAGLIAQGLVVGLYIFLRPLANVGFAFLGYLTVYPTFMSMLFEEITLNDPQAFHWALQLRQAPFFSLNVHSTVYTLLLQAGLIFSLFVIVHRKWRQESYHAYGKAFSLVFFAAVQVLLVGSLWQYLTKQRSVTNMVFFLGGGVNRSEEWPAMLGVFTYMFFGLSTGLSLLLLHVITPSMHTYSKGLNRARKLGLSGVPVTSDAESNLPYAMGYILMMGVSYTVLMTLAVRAGVFFTGDGPTWAGLLGVPLLAAGLIAYLAGARSAWGARGFFLFLFMLWFIPMFTFAIMVGAWSESVAGTYIASPSPPVTFYLAIAMLLDNKWAWPIESELRPHLPALIAIGGLLHAGLAAAFIHLGMRARRRVRDREGVVTATPAA